MLRIFRAFRRFEEEVFPKPLHWPLRLLGLCVLWLGIIFFSEMIGPVDNFDLIQNESVVLEPGQWIRFNQEVDIEILTPICTSGDSCEQHIEPMQLPWKQKFYVSIQDEPVELRLVSRHGDGWIGRPVFTPISLPQVQQFIWSVPPFLISISISWMILAVLVRIYQVITAKRRVLQ